ncbi:hypothetical protein [Embleya sp. MST-111070]|uniref:hypothetical protein n=1 Tax=Embleya sp. MST-111070 TaxID=3398231 RepID=UPI003F73A87D
MYGSVVNASLPTASPAGTSRTAGNAAATRSADSTRVSTSTRVSDPQLSIPGRERARGVVVSRGVPIDLGASRRELLQGIQDVFRVVRTRLQFRLDHRVFSQSGGQRRAVVHESAEHYGETPCTERHMASPSALDHLAAAGPAATAGPTATRGVASGIPDASTISGAAAAALLSATREQRSVFPCLQRSSSRWIPSDFL